MKIAKLIHNNNAGNAAHDKDELVNQIEAKGYKCHYSSTKKKGWKPIQNDVEFIIVAGGDGTVRKTAKLLLNRTLIDKTYPIALLPKGTANNIGKSLNLPDNEEALINSWQYEHLRKFDVGVIYNLDKPHFFLESFGFGVFPNLMNEMKLRKKNDIEDPEEKLKAALKLLKKIILLYNARRCDIVMDGVKHNGRYLMVEVMNTPSIGPNLHINPISDTADEEFEVILIPEEDKERLAQYVQDKIDGKDTPFFAKAIRGKNLTISWDGVHAHIDDELLKLERSFPIEIRLHENLLKFIAPKPPGPLEPTA
jgi:diacylglycerol kinase (ATP)